MPGTATGQQLIDELGRRFTLVERGEDRSGRGAVRYELRTGVVGVHVTYADGAEAPALLADVSTDGARFVTGRFPDRDQRVRLYFDVGDRGLVLNGRVSYIGCDRDTRYFGVQFTNGTLANSGTPEAGPGLTMPLWPVQSATNHLPR